MEKMYEDCRSLLMQSENILKEINGISGHQLRYKLQELLKTVQADLMLLLEFVSEVEACLTEEDIIELLNGGESER